MMVDGGQGGASSDPSVSDTLGFEDPRWRFRLLSEEEEEGVGSGLTLGFGRMRWWMEDGGLRRRWYRYGSRICDGINR